ncbi:hypothetical protein NQ468_001329 [Salmonella enterica]|uniref:hypothetical protein n=1 Tax=Salmonella enterica TaxID=28901 RepID=UPI0003BDB952|nr:hypothetical protein [Salmonella enterica]EHF2630410.1 hypothetical protein [Salmonella enterica subsp. enterica serovar Panama]EIS1621542.1 hypothetical protein [Salmonella enterica subsp. enterica serovar Sandiego]HAE7714169.1 hypothetical protein [Salmonella enterica subsp. enterica]EIT4523173.1 hypothetical protein [Salmonella enterica subsp. enterica serovar Sandiego]EJO0601092.1 hypothetical protein [Salmonella enterica]
MSIEYFTTVFICLSPGTGVVHHDGPDVFFASCDDEVMKIFTQVHPKLTIWGISSDIT